MRIETGSFFLLVGTLAAGGAAGYYANQKHVFDRLGPPTPPPPPSDPIPVASVPPPALVAPVKPAGPACEDTIGTPAACPPPYSADEGGCGGLPTKRCSDFKQTLKPRIAERAVACLNALKPNERCDPNRLNLCGHLALMSACQDPDDADRADGGSAVGVDAICQSILGECASAPLGPTLRDCHATLSGMSDLGRSRMVSCMATHCTDKSLLYCEGVVDVR